MEARSKMIETVSAIAGNSKMGMTVGDALALTNKTLKQRRTKRKSAKAARKRNRSR
jgi:hypothetical protein